MGNKQSKDDSRHSISCVSPATDEEPYGADGGSGVINGTASRKRSRKHEKAPTYPGLHDVTDYYNMNHDHRGIFMILDNRNVLGLSPRDGADEEVKQLECTFRKFGFEVRIKMDLSKNQVMTTMKEVASEDHRHYDCFALAVLTHGGEMDMLKAREGTYLTNQLYEMFNGNACASLQGKPKLFFFNACKGSKEDSVDYCTKSVAYKVASPLLSKPEVVVTSHIYSDFLCAFSTWEGFKSYRHQEKGSLYVQYLTEELSRGGKHGDDLTLILARVSRRLAERPPMERNKILRQTSYYQSSLTKRVILRPKI